MHTNTNQTDWKTMIFKYNSSFLNFKYQKLDASDAWLRW